MQLNIPGCQHQSMSIGECFQCLQYSELQCRTLCPPLSPNLSQHIPDLNSTATILLYTCSQDFQKWGYVRHLCMHKHARLGVLWGTPPPPPSPRKFLEIRFSEVASEAILGQKQSHSVDRGGVVVQDRT